MPLLKLEKFWADLACPQCGGPITEDRPRCASCRLEFPEVRGKPVLVDFERSVLDYDSVVRNSGQSPVIRTKHLPPWALKVLRGENLVAARQTQKLLDLARRTCERPRILVIGGGTVGSGLTALYTDPFIDLIAFDIYSSDFVQFLADAHWIPLRNECVDAVIIQAVLEHVLDPQRVVSEIARVLRIDGLVYADTPFLQHVHEGAYDFTRFTESGHRYLFRNFEEVSAGVVAGPGVQMIWSIDSLIRSLFRSPTAGKLASAAFFWLRWLDRAIPPAYSIDGASSCYFLGRNSGTQLSPRDLIKRYRGAQRV
jgi:SAM-dependent methyltransferase